MFCHHQLTGHSSNGIREVIWYLDLAFVFWSDLGNFSGTFAVIHSMPNRDVTMSAMGKAVRRLVGLAVGFLAATVVNIFSF